MESNTPQDSVALTLQIQTLTASVEELARQNQEIRLQLQQEENHSPTRVGTRGVRGSIMTVFFQIYYRTDKGWFFHNWNRCTPPRVGFPTYSGAVFAVQFSGLGWFEIFKKKNYIKN